MRRNDTAWAYNYIWQCPLFYREDLQYLEKVVKCTVHVFRENFRGKCPVIRC